MIHSSHSYILMILHLNRFSTSSDEIRVIELVYLHRAWSDITENWSILYTNRHN